MTPSIATLSFLGIEILAPSKVFVPYPAPMDRIDVCRWIRGARLACGWTQARLAEELGLTKANISHWETGKHDPSFAQLVKIRDLTGYSLADLVPPEEWPIPGVSRSTLAALPAYQRRMVSLAACGLFCAYRYSPSLWSGIGCNRR